MQPLNELMELLSETMMPAYIKVFIKCDVLLLDS